MRGCSAQVSSIGLGSAYPFHTRCALALPFPRQAEKDLRDLQSVLKIDDDIKKEQCKLFWVDVEAKQQRLKELEDKQEEIEAKAAERQKALDKAAADVAAKASPEEQTAEIERLKASCDEARNHVERLNKEVASTKKPVTQLERDIAAVKRKAAEGARDLNQKEKQIADEKAKAMVDAGPQERAIAVALDKARAEAEAAEDESRAARGEADEAEAAGRAAEARLRTAAGHTKALISEESDLKRERDRLRSATEAPAAQFGPAVPSILREIERETRWDARPVGPLGSHVKLTQEGQRWATAVGAVLGQRTLRTFAVSSMRDKDLLQGILRRCKASNDHDLLKLQYTARYGSAGMRPLARPTGLLVVENLVTVDHDVAFNALIEKTSMEQVALFETSREAEETCFEGPKGSKKPRQNLQRAVNVLGGSVAVNNGNFFASPPPKGRVTFGVDVQEQLEQVQGELGGAAQAVAAAKTAEAAVKAEKQQHFQAAKRAQECLEKLEGGRRKRDQAISALRRELDELKAETATDTKPWEDEAARLRASNAEFAEKEAELVKQRVDAGKLVKEKAAERAQYEETARGLADQMAKAEDDLSELMRDQEAVEKAFARAQQKLKACNDALETVRGDAAEAQASVEAATEAARKFTVEQLGPTVAMPLRVARDKEYVKTKIRALKVRKEQGLKSLPLGQRNLEEAMTKAVSTRQAYEEKIAGVRKVEANIEELNGDIAARLAKWKKFRKTISKIVRPNHASVASAFFLFRFFSGDTSHPVRERAAGIASPRHFHTLLPWSLCRYPWRRHPTGGQGLRPDLAAEGAVRRALAESPRARAQPRGAEGQPRLAVADRKRETALGR